MYGRGLTANDNADPMLVVERKALQPLHVRNNTNGRHKRSATRREGGVFVCGFIAMLSLDRVFLYWDDVGGVKRRIKLQNEKVGL